VDIRKFGKFEDAAKKVPTRIGISLRFDEFKNTGRHGGRGKCHTSGGGGRDTVS